MRHLGSIMRCTPDPTERRQGEASTPKPVERPRSAPGAAATVLYVRPTGFAIRRVEAELLSVPTLDPFRIATGEVHATRSVAVTVHLEQEGQEARGLAEGSCLPPVTREDQPDALAAVLRAKSYLERTWANLDAFASALDQLLGTTPVARSAVEVAVLSALASIEGVPLWRFLAPEAGEPPLIETDITLPILSPERMASLAKSWWEVGFRKFKVKVGRDLEHDLRALEAVARVIPLAVFQPDANGGLSPSEALRYAKAVHDAGLTISCFEQPCASLEDVRKVHEQLQVPVIADESIKNEHDLDRILEANAAGGINLKISKMGSLLRCLAIGRRARARGLSLMVGGMVETRLGMSAAAHLSAALGGVEFADLDTAWLLAHDPFEGGYRAEHPEDAERPGPRYRVARDRGLGVVWR